MTQRKPMTEDKLMEISGLLKKHRYDFFPCDVACDMLEEICALRKVAEAGIKLRDDKSKSAAEFKKALKEAGWLE